MTNQDATSTTDQSATPSEDRPEKSLSEEVPQKGETVDDAAAQTTDEPAQDASGA